MKVFVWKAYGRTTAHRMEIDRDLMKILEIIESGISDWGDDGNGTVKVWNAVRGKGLVAGCAALEAWLRPHIGTHELFEIAEFVTLQ